ncbi:MAG: 8-oxo-dGTP diphosphatase [Planctomycetales bacterium]|nr:8-oxo-dGTP diphosphatase [Planctomycetales bacterium]
MSGFRLTTLGYVLRGDSVLLMRRTKQPNLGLWTAPGGKIAPGESPEECVAREIAEEAGLTVRAPRLRAVITQTADDPEERWMLFGFLAREFSGEPPARCREGEFRWVPVAELLSGALPIPDADRVFTPWLFEPGDGVVSAKFWHRADLSVERWERYA